jgi:nicotinamidase-related amidase
MSTPSLRQVVGVPNSTASVKDSVLVVIDAQDEYIYGSLPAQDYKEVNVVISNLLDKYRKQNGHVVHVLHSMGADEAPIFKPNGKLTKEMDGVEAIEGESVVWKKHAGSFSETDLAEVIKKTGLKKLVLTGYMAHGCVSSTAREATTLGYETLVVEDGVGQRDMKDIPAAQVKKVALMEIDDMFGTVLRGSEIE